MSQDGNSLAYSGTRFQYATRAEILAAAAALPALGIIVVILRFYTRLLQKAKLGIDDFLILPALVLVCGMGAALIAGVEQEAVGYPTPPPPGSNPELVLTWHDPKITVVQKVQYITQLLMIAAYGFIKLSIIFFYRRIFTTSKSDRFNLITIVCACIVVAWTLAYILAIAFNCGTHWGAHWGSVAEIITYCQGTQQLVESLLITDLITDVIIIALPMPRIWGLHLTLARKIAITAIFLLGGVAIGAAAARLGIYMTQIKYSLDPTMDENKSVSTVLYWSMIEAGLSLIAACLPTTQHLFRGRSIGSVVASVRSAISLPSFTGTGGSGGSRGSRSNKSNAPAPGAQGQTAIDSLQKLSESESLAGRSSGASREPGVNKTVTIEMTRQNGDVSNKYGTETWETAV
ncbi:hypothetical protein GL218_05716 [Daldinia childiae]|uniref:uncharacterized protein n=1 Tax=Daldinia childiae TaxID=326645 RepID=UPI001447C0DA|nr:uncharacterized protein GL218_05716 [Daldinia childiae]KAF3058031.1 hypothetical protein GL218_05716 [Daldinia childiae]